MSESSFSKLSQCVIKGEESAVVLAELQKMLDADVPPQTIMDKHLIPAMEEVGRLFEENEYFVPELMLSARTMKEAMSVINPLLSQSGVDKLGRVVIGTVFGDMHDIGKNLVAAMLEGGGFEVVDLGVNVSAEKFIKAASDQPGTIICLSALLTTTMPQMKKFVDLLKEKGIRDQYRIMVGGAPVTDQFARQIGADGYSDNASAAVILAKALIS